VGRGSARSSAHEPGIREPRVGEERRIGERAQEGEKVRLLARRDREAADQRALVRIAAPVAGTIRIPWWQFAAVDGLGIILWATTFELLGFAFSNQLEQIAAYAWKAGAVIVALIVMGLLVFYVAQKYRRRQQFLRDLHIARMTPVELKEKLDRHEAVTVVDLRHSLDFLPEPYTIPGAIRIPMEELDERNSEIPRNQEVVLYCTCPNEASSALTAMKLRRHGITRVHPLQGGFHGWRELGFPIHSEFGAAPPAKRETICCTTCPDSDS